MLPGPAPTSVAAVYTCVIQTSLHAGRLGELGEVLCNKASNGAKKMEVTAEGDDLETVFPDGFSKSLRYGACLELVKVCQDYFNSAG